MQRSGIRENAPKIIVALSGKPGRRESPSREERFFYRMGRRSVGSAALHPGLRLGRRQEAHDARAIGRPGERVSAWQPSAHFGDDRQG